MKSEFKDQIINAANRKYFSSKFYSAIDAKSRWKIFHDIGVGKSKSYTIYRGDVYEISRAFIKIPSRQIDGQFYYRKELNVAIGSSFEV